MLYSHFVVLFVDASIVICDYDPNPSKFNGCTCFLQPFVESLATCPKYGLHNPLRGQERSGSQLLKINIWFLENTFMYACMKNFLDTSFSDTALQNLVFTFCLSFERAPNKIDLY